MKIVYTLLLLIFPVLIVQTAAQSDESGKNLGKNAVSVRAPVIVSDREGHYIPNLKKEDFSIFQNGVKQNITFFATYDEPLNVALLLDTSGSTEEVVKKIKSAAGDFVKLLNSQDKCLIATFDNQVKILNDFTSDRQTLKSSVAQIRNSKFGGTLMYNAVEQIAQKSFADVAGRKVIVLLTDGEDFGSFVTKDQLLGEFEESDVLVYTVFYRTGEKAAANGKKTKRVKKNRRLKNVISPTATVYLPTDTELAAQEKDEEAAATEILKKISDTTAGRFYLSDAPKLNDTFKRVAGELRQQYRLGFRVRDASAVRDVIVKVARPDAAVRVRGNFRSR